MQRSFPLTIRTKVCAVVALTFVGLLSTLFLTFNHVLEGNFTQMEEDAARQDLDRISHAVQRRIDAIGTVLDAWSKWDDMYQFVEHPTKSFQETNFTFAALMTPGADYFYLLGADASVREALAINKTNRIVESAPDTLTAEIQRRFQPLSAGAPPRGGLLRAGDRIYFFAATTVSDTMASKPANGVTLFLERVTDLVVKDIGRELNLDLSKLEILSADQEGVREHRDFERFGNNLNARIVLRDVVNRPVLELLVDLPRNLYAQGVAARNSVLRITLVSGLISLLVTLLLLNKVVVSRIQLLKEQLHGITNDPAKRGRLDIESNDEMQSLAEDINVVLDRLDELRQRAEDSNAAKTRFLAHMSHEIRTPMNGVLGILELLRSTPMNAEQRPLLDAAHFSAQTLIELVNDVLEISKIEARKLVLSHQPFDLRALFTETARLMEVGATRKNLVYVTAIADGLPTIILGDRAKVGQVIGNLLSNAVKFTQNGAVVFQAWAYPVGDGQFDVWVAVSDTGMGIPYEVQTRLFQPFEQGGTEVSEKFGGTGLGLSISSQIIRLMEGELLVRSRPKFGSAFYFSIRVQTASESELTKSQVVTFEPTGPLDILVAEDNRVNQMLSRKLLEKAGHKVTIAENGRRAVELFGNGRFDLVLLDIHMPEMNGEEALREIRQLPNGLEIPIIALTANALDGAREHYIEAGMNGYLSKPIKAEDLNQEIGRVLGAADQRRARASR